MPLPEHVDGIDMLPLLLGKKEPDPERALFWNTHGSQIARWKQWRIVKFLDEADWRLYDIVADPGETTDLAKQHPDVTKAVAGKYEAWLSGMAKPVEPVRPPAELLPHTNNGSHARRPFGSGWMTVGQWDKIKDDFTQWSEFHVRQRMMAGKNKDGSPQQ
jgi:arylsulfatase A-like enzyme